MSLSGCNSSLMDLGAVQRKYENQLISLPEVVGVGIGECAKQQACLKVFVVKETPELRQQIPSHLEGFKVEIETIGPLEVSSPFR